MFGNSGNSGIIASSRINGRKAWMIGILGLTLSLGLSACGGEPDPGNTQERGVLWDPGPVKADGTNSCSNICGEQSPSGCWCDALCVGFGDCCPDKQSACGGPAPVKTCADITCGAGYHCELKGINGGSVPACIKDPVVGKTCQDLGGSCLPLTYPMGQCKADEQADTTAGLCGGVPGQSSTCCVKVAPTTVQVTESDDGKTISAQVGATVEVKLLGNPTTGYEWTLVSGSKGLPLSSSQYTPDPALPGVVGGGGSYSFLFKVGALAAGGQHTLAFEYARSWEPQPLETFSVTIQVP